MTTITDLKIYLLNAVTLAFNFTKIDISLKILLTAVAIGYTLHKWWLMNKENKEKEALKKAAENKAKDLASGKTILKNGVVRKNKPVRDDLHSS